MGWTVFGAVDLSVVKGLESVIHAGPSTIGIDTVYASQGRIPEVFLRGAGVPDEFITYMRSLVGRPIEFYSCFISYSSKDQEFAERLHADLQARGVRCWFAPEDIQGGRKLHEQIEQAIRHYDKLLLVLSEHSMGSEWVKTEIYHARQDEMRSRRRKLFPDQPGGLPDRPGVDRLRRGYGQGHGAGSARVFCPRLLGLEGPRRVPEGVRPAAARPQGRGVATLNDASLRFENPHVYSIVTQIAQRSIAHLARRYLRNAFPMPTVLLVQA